MENKIFYNGIECHYSNKAANEFWIMPLFSQHDIGSGCGMGKTISTEQLANLRVIEVLNDILNDYYKDGSYNLEGKIESKIKELKPQSKDLSDDLKDDIPDGIFNPGK